MSFDWFNLDSMLSFDTPEESTYLLQAAGWSTGETSSSFLVKGRCPVAAQQQQQKSLLMLPLAKPQPHPSYKHQASPIVAGQRRSPQVKFSRLASSVRLFVRSLYPVRYQENATGEINDLLSDKLSIASLGIVRRVFPPSLYLHSKVCNEIHT